MRDPERLLADQSFLVSLARALVSDPGSAEDLVQDTTLAALRGAPPGESVSRSWLSRVMRNLAVNQRRRRSRRRQRERRVARSEVLPSTVEFVQREEIRRKVVDAVMQLQEPYRSSILYRYAENLPPQEIARRLEVPVETVKTRLKRGLAKLKQLLDQGSDGTRKDWQLALLPILERATVHGTPVGGTSLGMGVVIMSLKSKAFVVLTFTLLALLGSWIVSINTGDPTSEQVRKDVDGVERVSSSAESTARKTNGRDAITPLKPSTGDRATVPVRDEKDSGAVELGSLRLSLRWKDSGRGVTLARGTLLTEGDLWRGAHGLTFITDVQGTWAWQGQPGKIRIMFDGAPPADVVVRAGQQTSLDIELDLAGCWVSGTVTDEEGNALQGAGIWLGAYRMPDHGTIVASSDEDGGFELRLSKLGRCIAVRHEEYAPSDSRLLEGGQGTRLSVHFILSAAAGALTGVVVDSNGEPVDGAAIQLGEDAKIYARTDRENHRIGSVPPLHLRTDAEGRFLAEGLSGGERRIRVSTARHGRQEFTALISPGETTDVELQLSAGAAVYGMVQDELSQPIPGAVIRVSRMNPRTKIASFLTSVLSEEDGTFSVHGIQAKEIHLTASRMGQTFGDVAETFRLESADLIEWNPVLPPNYRVAGHVLNHEGDPLARCKISIPRDKNSWLTGLTNPEGFFEVQFVPDRPLTVYVYDPEQEVYPMLHVSDVAPDTVDLVIRVPQIVRATASFEGNLVDARGEPFGGARVTARPATGGSRVWHTEA